MPPGLPLPPPELQEAIDGGDRPGQDEEVVEQQLAFSGSDLPNIQRGAGGRLTMEPPESIAKSKKFRNKIVQQFEINMDGSVRNIDDIPSELQAYAKASAEALHAWRQIPGGQTPGQLAKMFKDGLLDDTSKMGKNYIKWLTARDKSRLEGIKAMGRAD